ncbi:hypothetical protein MMC26_006649 [Xylographa opegraphella]|nr:hypothetical protein [Xylographa opegraphella]
MDTTGATLAVASTTGGKSSLDSSFPLELPYDPALVLPEVDFNNYIHKLLAEKSTAADRTGKEAALANLEIKSPISNDTSMVLDEATDTHKDSDVMDGIRDAPSINQSDADDGFAFESTGSPLLDLFFELDSRTIGSSLEDILEAAWKEDSLATLKVVWNARSIHLGKGVQDAFYKCLGWMKNEHPETVFANLPWLFRPVIEKKVRKDVEAAAVMVEKKVPTNEDSDDVYGVSHGYWKDLLNILVLAVNRCFNVSDDPRHVLKTIHKPRTLNPAESKSKKHKLEKQRHANVLTMLKDPFYKALHLSVARLFADQLKKDLELLKSDSPKDRSKISLAAKWAPSLEGFHDKHTIIVTSIAEILYPYSTKHTEGAELSREIYLKYAREHYRRNILSPLREALQIVERDISAKNFHAIDFAKVPTIAMSTYKKLFVKKSPYSFETYIDEVAEGKSQLSGRILSPAKLILQARRKREDQASDSESDRGYYADDSRTKKSIFPRKSHDQKDNSDNEKFSVRHPKAKTAKLMGKVLDGQWASLVKHIKDSDILANSIAVCNVNPRMEHPLFSDNTSPRDISVGLSLLVAEVVEAPFGGKVVTFNSFGPEPQFTYVGGPKDKHALVDKVQLIKGKECYTKTDLSAIFESLILPMAIKSHLKQKDMVKQVLVFGDSPFNAARHNFDGTAYNRIKRKYAEAGFEMPQLIFWNVNSTIRKGRASAPKPVTRGMEGIILVTGYSQAMVKTFLENGRFDEATEVEVEDMGVKGEDDEYPAGSVGFRMKRQKLDPLAEMWKAIGHEAYSMLRVVD